MLAIRVGPVGRGGVLEVENTNTCSYSVEHKLLPSFTKILQDLH